MRMRICEHFAATEAKFKERVGPGSAPRERGGRGGLGGCGDAAGSPRGAAGGGAVSPRCRPVSGDGGPFPPQSETSVLVLGRSAWPTGMTWPPVHTLTAPSLSPSLCDPVSVSRYGVRPAGFCFTRLTQVSVDVTLPLNFELAVRQANCLSLM